MARVTTEDCIDKVSNRFELVLLAAKRARELSSGSLATVDDEDDKNPVIALREIAEETQTAENIRERAISSYQTENEVDEPDDDPMSLPYTSSIGGGNGRDSDDYADAMSEEDMLRKMIESKRKAESQDEAALRT